MHSNDDSRQKRNVLGKNKILFATNNYHRAIIFVVGTLKTEKLKPLLATTKKTPSEMQRIYFDHPKLSHKHISQFCWRVTIFEFNCDIRRMQFILLVYVVVNRFLAASCYPLSHIKLENFALSVYILNHTLIFSSMRFKATPSV